MARHKRNSMTDVLKRTILESGMSLLAIEKATGVDRTSLGRFLKDERSIRLDLADKLAAYFGLELRKRED